MKIGLRAALIIAPMAGLVALMVTLDPLTAVFATVLGGLVTGIFFGVADWIGRRRT